jgi:two-component system, chemotaxis family, sensor kinase CheA
MTMSDTQCQDEFFADMLPDFLDEADNILEQLNEHLLQLDEWVKQAADDSTESCDAAMLNEMFRAAHTLKGLSAMLGLSGINTLTHKVENIFDAARSDKLRISSDVVDVTFQSVDRLNVMVGRLKDGQDHIVDCESVLVQIHQILEEGGLSQPAAKIDFETALANHGGAEVESPAPSAPTQSNSETTPVAPVSPFTEITDDYDPTSKYASIFIDETESTLDELTERLLEGAEENITEQCLVLCHRIKGSAAAVGLRRAAKLAHCMEDLLQTLNDNGAQPTVPMVDALLDGTEALRLYVQQLKQGANETGGFDAAYDKLINSSSAPAKAAEKRPSVQTSAAKPPEQSAPPKTAAGLTESIRSHYTALVPVGERAFIGQVTFRSGLTGVGLKARLAYERISHLGEVFHCQPAECDLDDLDTIETFTFGIVSVQEELAIREKLRIDGIDRVEVELLPEGCSEPAPEVATTTPVGATEPATTAPAAVASPAETLAPTAPQPAAEQKAAPSNTPDAAADQKAAKSDEKGEKPTETVRVDIERLDQLMNLAGQLVINKARFGQIATGLKQLASGRQNSHHVTDIFNVLKRLESDLSTREQSNGVDAQFDDLRAHTRRIYSSLEVIQRHIGQLDGVRNSVNELSEAMHQLDRVSDGIQKCVMDTRMVPIGPLFGRFKRVIRDISRGNGKEIRLLIHGEKTELDKRMIDELGDPLIHIVRNSADHGIESPEVREANGKPREGTVTLDASHRGNSIVIQIRDDGKGLDVERIRRKAIEKNILSAADAEKLTDHQVYQLIWEPGFSTAEKVTEISGRGMGMDIVRSKIEEINGTVELSSVPGQGTTITIKLPLTLAILPSLLSVVNGDVFAIPVESVGEIVSVPRTDLTSVHGLEAAVVRGRVISVVKLEQLFEWNRRAGAESTSRAADDTTTLVIIGSDGHEIGLVVDELLGEDDIVIKSLAENYRNVEGVAGASILGNGRVSLILDVGAIVARASQAAPVEIAG